MVCLWPQLVFDWQAGEIPDAPDDVDDICDKIRGATKGFGTDEDELIEALGSLNLVSRYHVAQRYEEEFGTDLRELIESEEGGSTFSRVLQLVAQRLEVAECCVIRKAVKGFGTGEKLLYGTLCGRTNEEINLLKETYYNLYEEDLAVVINEEVEGDLEQFLTACLQASEEEFDPEAHTEEKAEEDARTFDKAGREAMGTDESTLFKIICESPPEYLKMVNTAYIERRGYSLDQALIKELGGDAENAAVHAVNMKLIPELTAVRFIESTMSGVGTEEYDLAAAIVRYQALLGCGFPAYEEEFGTPLVERVEGELRGDLEKLVIAMVNADVSME